MADCQIRGNLFEAPLHLKQTGSLLSRQRLLGTSVAALLITLDCNYKDLLRPVAFTAQIVRKFPVDVRLVSIKQLGDLSLFVSCFYKGVDLISLKLGGMFVVHRRLRQSYQEALNTSHYQQPSLKLIKVSLRA
jgi:hypothetical protein